jgi:hypothetical protein
MALFGFEFTYTDEHLSKPVISDFSCEIDIDREPGQFVVAGVYLDGASEVRGKERREFNMLLGDPITQRIGTAAIEAAERELDSERGRFYEQVCQFYEDEMADYDESRAEARAELYAERRM